LSRTESQHHTQITMRTLTILLVILFTFAITVYGSSTDTDIDSEVDLDEIQTPLNSTVSSTAPVNTTSSPTTITSKNTPTPPPADADPFAPSMVNTPIAALTAVPKGTPGRHCDLRSHCEDCLAVSYCLWSPSRATCVDKSKATPKDDAIATCDPDVCAAHGGKNKYIRRHKPKDTRKGKVVTVSVQSKNSLSGKPVIASAIDVDKLRKRRSGKKNKKNKSYKGSSKHKGKFLKKNKRVKGHFPKTHAPQPFVHVKPGKKRYVFTSDNRGPVIRGEKNVVLHNINVKKLKLKH